MPVSKTRKYTRKTAKRYSFVEFTSELFDGSFAFPTFEHMPIRVIEALNTGALQDVVQWLRDAGVDPESIEAFRDLDTEEIEGFIEAWSTGQPVTVPKS